MELTHNTNYKFGFLNIFDLSNIFVNVTKIFENNQTNRKYFGIVGVFVKEIVIFNIGFGFVVFKSIW